MICDDCKKAADLPTYAPPEGAEGVLTSDAIAVQIARKHLADRVERARIGHHERCRRRDNGCTCQHGDHGTYRPQGERSPVLAAA